MNDAALYDLTRQGREALKRLDRDAAEACFAQALDERPGFVDAIAGLGSVAFERGDLQGAVRQFTAAVDLSCQQLGGVWPARLDPSDPVQRSFLRSLHGLGLVRYRLGELPVALRWLKLAQRLDPADTQGSRYLIRNIDARRHWAGSAQ